MTSWKSLSPTAKLIRHKISTREAIREEKKLYPNKSVSDLSVQFVVSPKFVTKALAKK